MNEKYDFDARSFGMRLKEIREFYNMTQEKIAEHVGVSLKSIQNWERGEKIPNIDNAVKLAELYGMSVGEILEDEAYRIFEKKKDSRKRSIEIFEAPNKIEVYFEITEDRYYDRYEAWVWDELAEYKHMCCSTQKLIGYKTFKDGILSSADEIISEYRAWLFKELANSEKNRSIKEELEGKIRCENAGMAAPGAEYFNGRVWYCSGFCESDN